jgi:hypothetical protein
MVTVPEEAKDYLTRFTLNCGRGQRKILVRRTCLATDLVRT